MDESIKIRSLNVSNYRGLSDLHITDLSTINIFVGANNCGKTSVLEAIKLMSAPTDIGQLVAVALQRVQATKDERLNNLVNYMLNIFHTEKDEDARKYYELKLSADIDGALYSYDVDGNVGEVTDSAAETKKVFDVAIKTTKDNRVNTYCTGKLINGEDTKLEATQVPLFTALYLHSNVSYYKSCVKFLSEYIIADGKQDILKILQTFDKHIEDISIVGNDIYLFNSISGSLPLFSYGSGLQKALLLTSTIVNCKNGIILIDEIDNAIHVSAFKDVFKWFVDACIKNNVQAFITTHSMEAIDAILDIAHSNYSDEDLLRVITLRKSAKDNSTSSKQRTGEKAFKDREMFRMELRV